MKVVIQSHAAAAVDVVVAMVARELHRNPYAVLGLATGRTMDPVYAGLVALYREGMLDFSNCRTFNLDEYAGLHRDNPHSYHAYMKRHLFDAVNLRPHYTHLPDGTAADLAAECLRYEQLISRLGGIDLQLLGIGLNGHIGFNEPPCDLASRTHVEELSPETMRQNTPLFSGPDQVPHHAITMGMGTILESGRCLLLATGIEKAEIVAGMIEGPVSNDLPATALQTHLDCTVILDQPAAARLRQTVAARDFWTEVKASPAPGRSF